jgi:Ca2+-binding RTX toxin-like protein
VDLLNNVAFQGAAAIYNITYVHGGAGDDFIRGDAQDNWIVGNGGHDILVGGEGGDWLQGGDGQDLLFGGNGFDQLDGGNGEDLLFGGPTAYDNDDAALNDIWAEWTRTDLAYADRIATLRTGTSSGYVLDATTVFEDADADLLYGEGDLDWFWGTDGLDVMDRVDPDEVLN